MESDRVFTLKDFDYNLPEDLIAQEPSHPRNHSRLLTVKKNSSEFKHQRFDDLPSYLRKGDVLILNNTKVLPARLIGNRETGGKIEVFLIKKTTGLSWVALIRPGGKVKKGERIQFASGEHGLVLHVEDDPIKGVLERRVRFDSEWDEERLEQVGHVPLPPYIKRADQESDATNYQTVFAAKPGAVAAPTAGLHFTDEILQGLRDKGVEIEFVTLHVSYGTFQPVQTENLEDHPMFEEFYEVPERTADRVNLAKNEGRRIIACGTTSVRTLESSPDAEGRLQSGSRSTKLFIYPPFSFRVVDAMITNFHLPKSSLLMLVSAFAGYGTIRQAYEVAVKEQYRFFSYGDAMLLY